MSFATPIPVFRIFDEEKAKDHYIGFLGFEISWEHRFELGTPIYFQVQKGDCILHLSEHHGDAIPGSAIRVSVVDVAALQQELLAKKYKYSRPGILDQPWGRDMTIADPFGNRITFTTLKKKDETC